MIEAGILEGDTVLIKKTEAADTGDIVVALIDEEEATLKRFRRRGASIALEPANTAYEVRILPPTRVRIQGKMVGSVPALLSRAFQSPASKSSARGVASRGCDRAAGAARFRGSTVPRAQGRSSPRGRAAVISKPSPLRRSAIAPLPRETLRSIAQRLALAGQFPARDHDRGPPAVLLEGVGRDDLRDQLAAAQDGDAAGRCRSETPAPGSCRRAAAHRRRRRATP